MQSSKELVAAYMEDVWVNRNVALLDKYVSSEKFTNQIIQSIKNNQIQSLMFKLA